jgi:hypothetical protein
VITCKECGTTFESDKSFHGHLKKHKLLKSDYYEKHYPKVCLHTGKKIQWKESDDLQSYLSRDFFDRTALNLYFDDDVFDAEKKREVLLKYLDNSYTRHDVVPSQSELVSLPSSPNILHYQKFFDFDKLLTDKQYKSRFCYSCDYSKPLVLDHISPESFCISVDTREQQPYRFYKSVSQKLNYGDYCLSGQNYNKIHIERKSIADFGGTLVGGNERFRRELDKVKADGAYLIILVEFNLHDLHKHKFFGYANAMMIAHAMRNIYRDYSDICQFAFGNNRESCVKYVVEFLLFGQALRALDCQLYIDSHKNKFSSCEFTKEDLIKLYDNS